MLTATQSPSPDSVAGEERLLAGIDVGGSKIAVLVTDRSLGVCGRATVPTAVGDPARAVDRIVMALIGVLETTGASPDQLAAVGVGVPGRIDRSSGTVSMAVNLGWEQLPLGARLAERLGRPVRVENDVRAAAAGLHARRVLGEVDDLAFLSIGTGISAGVVLGGRLHRGVRGMAGEIGHVILDPTGPRCSCGSRGCFEALASGPAIARRASERVLAGDRTSLAGVRPIRAEDVFGHASAGDPLASEIVEDLGRWVARAVHELVLAYDVRVVAIGGGVAAAGEGFMAPIMRGLAGLRRGSAFAREVLPPDVVRLLPRDADAGAWGAVLLARDMVAGTGEEGEEVHDAQG